MYQKLSVHISKHKDNNHSLLAESGRQMSRLGRRRMGLAGTLSHFEARHVCKWLLLGGATKPGEWQAEGRRKLPQNGSWEAPTKAQRDSPASDQLFWRSWWNKETREQWGELGTVIGKRGKSQRSMEGDKSRVLHRSNIQRSTSTWGAASEDRRWMGVTRPASPHGAAAWTE